MAYYSLSADFFVGPSGSVTIKAGPIPDRTRHEIYMRDNKRCQSCRTAVRFGGNTVSPFDKIRASATDHIFPRSRGGQNDYKNLQLLCISCNAAKGAKVVGQWQG